VFPLPLRPILRVLSGLLLCPGVLEADSQQPNLNVTPTADRFPITGRVWPSQPGQAVICLWEDDKLCAMTMSVDDNIAPQVPTWLARAAEVGFPVTWFVITDRIGGSNAGFNGTWALWRDVVAKGHDVQSHTRQHLHTELPDWPGIEGEYAGSKAAIEANIPGHRCDYLAFPGGANSGLNDPSVAAQIYSGARGGAGSGINRPTRIDYLRIRNGNFHLGNGPKHNDMLSLFDASDVRYYRGWIAPLFHQVNDWPGVEPYLEFLRTYRQEIWAAKFSDVAKYGQSRDTATLTILSNTADGISFNLTDLMLDEKFDYPLTIKIRLPNHWPAVAARQAGAAVEADFVRHDGQPYALVKVVPDRGAAEVFPASDSQFGGQPYDRWLQRHILPSDRSGLGAPTAIFPGDETPNLMKYALGLDPRQPGLRQRVTMIRSPQGQTGVQVVRPFPVPTDAVYEVMTSTDLQNWSVTPLLLEEQSLADGAQTVVAWAPEAATPTTRFFRLRVRLVGED